MVAEARASLELLQSSLLGSDSRVELGLEEKETAKRLNILVRMEESMMFCFLLEYWNTSYFFSTLKRRHNRNIITSLTRDDGVVLTNSVEVKGDVV